MYTNKCKWCNEDIIVENSKQFGGHVGNCTMNTDRKNRLELKRKNDYMLFNFNCIKCGKEYELELLKVHYNNDKYKKFCSRSCANSRIVTEEHKLKTSCSMINKCRVYFNKCKYCNKLFTSKKKREYCDRKCIVQSRIDSGILSKWGLMSVKVQSENRRSKNEIYFSKICNSYFINVECNKNIFNGWDADVIIHDIKYAILWNGKWHYEKITEKHSVEQVKNRDSIKVKEIIKYGYIPYIIKDMGKFNKLFVEEQFNIFINIINNLRCSLN